MLFLSAWVYYFAFLIIVPTACRVIEKFVK